ncbi:aminopeptidase [Aestuariivirga litoralis]|uniref:Aminopeptidase n=1 Tax=Aestuariivirga litoralis TaxID=2650924 RepID=A0A2W2BBY7_9HYPH|nr:aminopeptidase [Aestuariivirga litoralis]PZF77688.1 aminopeptidase [Aestuariivirga litoralis]
MTQASNHEKLLDTYARLAVRTGLNLQAGQQLLISAPLDAVPLVRRITEHAYKAGASLVTTVYADDVTTLARFQHAPEAAFDVAPEWLFNGMAEAFRGGAARLAIAGENPALLAGQDPEKLSRANKARSKAYRPALELITGFAINWCVIAAATPAWARSVFPGVSEAEAVDRLWQAIFACTKADLPDPIAAWETHNADLRRRTEFLNRRRYRALKYTGPGTDLMLGLAEEHVWKGGGGKALNGVFCNANIPTEEVFTAPHKELVDGIVCSSKPLSYQGSLIDGIRVRFERGRIVEMTAENGQDAFRNLIDTDEGAARLGEVALVPHSSPISKSGIIFNNTLFDENAASHIAVGQSYTENIRDGSRRSKEELAALGANSSLVHVDWMIGSGELDVDGIMADGTAEPLMRKGEWAI